jgi:hypothetical protein
MLAGELNEGDTIPALDNAYVLDTVSTDDTAISIRQGSFYSDYPYVIPEGYVLLTLDLGEAEGYLILPADAVLDVYR